MAADHQERLSTLPKVTSLKAEVSFDEGKTVKQTLPTAYTMR
ncbi:hypothetical protein [Streptomyces sp. NPDC059979]